MGGPRRITTTDDYIADLISRGQRSEAGCLIWQGKPGNSGYAMMYVPLAPDGDGRVVKGVPKAGKTSLHRIIWMATHGPIPRGVDVEHRCHTESDCLGGPSCLHRLCYELSHLEAITHAENLRRGNRRGAPKRGEWCRSGRHLIADVGVYTEQRKRNGGKIVTSCQGCRREAENRYRARQGRRP